MNVANFEVLRIVASASLPIFVMGGLAEDILLGRDSGERGDLDLLVDRELWPRVVDALKQQGLSSFETLVTGPAEEPLAYVSRGAGLPVEAWLFGQESEGCEITLPGSVPGGSSGYFRLRLPADTFSHPPTIVDGIEVRTVSPLALCILRGASAETRGGPERCAADREMAGILKQRFLDRMDSKLALPRLIAV